MEYLGGDPNPSWEVKAVAFFPLQEAKKLLKYKGDKEIFEKTIKLINGNYCNKT